MIYRKFGNTGETISAIGFGCMRLPEMEQDGVWSMDQEKINEMFRYAYEHGINYFDTAPFYCHHNSEAAVGEGVKPFRDKVLLSTKLPAEKLKQADEMWEYLERSLTRLQTDHIDFYHIWATNWGDFSKFVLERGLLSLLRRAKEQGMVRHLCFSFHDKHENIRRIIEAAEAEGVPMESMLVQYNMLDRGVEDMLKYANGEKGLGTVAMGPVGGGRLAARTKFTDALAGDTGLTSYELAFRFVLGNPNMCCALSGMQNLDMVKQNCAIAESERPLSEEEWRTLGESVEKLRRFSELYCTGCGYCQPCPVGINIPYIFDQYTHHNVYGLSENAKNGYRHYVEKDNGKTFADCIGCGKCEANCPQKLPIREKLEMVDKALRALWEK